MTKEVLKIALEALEPLEFVGKRMDGGNPKIDEAITAIKEALAQPEQEPKCGAIIEVFGKDWRLEYLSLPVGKHKLYTQQYTYIPSPKQKVVGWKLVPIKPTDEMLKAMDECSTEGYDERLYAGHAASVYMAAVDVAPTPPQRKEPEPVVWMYQDKSTHEVRFQKHMRGFVDHGATYETPLYTTPPQRKPLTDEEIYDMYNEPRSDAEMIAFARAIEAAHGITGEKNGTR